MVISGATFCTFAAASQHPSTDHKLSYYEMMGEWKTGSRAKLDRAAFSLLCFYNFRADAEQWRVFEESSGVNLTFGVSPAIRTE